MKWYRLPGTSELPTKASAVNSSRRVEFCLSKDGIASVDVAKLVLAGVSYLISDSGYKHFVLALMIADKNLYASANCDKIVARATSRGLISR